MGEAYEKFKADVAEYIEANSGKSYTPEEICTGLNLTPVYFRDIAMEAIIDLVREDRVALGVEKQGVFRRDTVVATKATGEFASLWD